MDDDPGWQLSWKTALYMVLPRLAVREARRAPDALVFLRRIFLAFCSALVLIGVVVAILGDLHDGDDPTFVPVLVVAAWGSAAIALSRVVRRALDCSSPASLAATYRTRFFVRVAVAESAALMGFVMDIVTGVWWVYYVGAAFAAIGFAMLAPTRAHLRRESDALALNGCLHSLVAALRGRSTPV